MTTPREGTARHFDGTAPQIETINAEFGFRSRRYWYFPDGTVVRLEAPIRGTGAHKPAFSGVDTLDLRRWREHDDETTGEIMSRAVNSRHKVTACGGGREPSGFYKVHMRHGAGNWQRVGHGSFLKSSQATACANAIVAELSAKFAPAPKPRRANPKKALAELLAWLDGEHDDDSALTRARELIAA